ncbi:MAG: hypothetical protein B7Z23_14365, partial [Pseudomonadales bacterium 32-61-5]
CRTGSYGWVMSRDLHHYSFDHLLRSNPWPLLGMNALPEQMSEPWYPALRQAMESLHEERSKLFGGSVADWLQSEAASESVRDNDRSRE